MRSLTRSRQVLRLFRETLLSGLSAVKGKMDVFKFVIILYLLFIAKNVSYLLSKVSITRKVFKISRQDLKLRQSCKIETLANLYWPECT
jgi:hypothetical protein